MSEVYFGTDRSKINPEARDRGIRREWPGPGRTGFALWIRPAAAWSTQFQAAIQRAIASELEQQAADGAKEPAAGKFDFNGPSFVAEALVAGWDGVVDAEGESVEFTVDRCAAALADPGNSDVLHWAITEANRLGQFYTKALEQDEGNLSSGSDTGKKDGADASETTKS